MGSSGRSSSPSEAWASPHARKDFSPEYKGDCSYFNIEAAGESGTNAVWSYEAPFAAVATIKDYLAFYPERVDAISVQEV